MRLRSPELEQVRFTEYADRIFSAFICLLHYYRVAPRQKSMVQTARSDTVNPSFLTTRLITPLLFKTGLHNNPLAFFKSTA